MFQFVEISVNMIGLYMWSRDSCSSVRVCVIADLIKIRDTGNKNATYSLYSLSSTRDSVPSIHML